MNLKRGLFRLWLLVSVVYVIAIGLTSWDGIERQFRQQAYLDQAHSPTARLPVNCENARGARGQDYIQAKDLVANPYQTFCWYEQNRYRELFPERADWETNILLFATYDDVGQRLAPAFPWQRVTETLVFAVVPPIILLAFGAALLWAFAGFRTDRA